MPFDVAVVGGGPAGLACSIAAAQQGLSVVVLEKRALPCDKACGEGVMPSGVRALDGLGVLSSIDPLEIAPIRGVRYIDADGSSALGLLPSGGGLGIRRVELSRAMTATARSLGVDVRDRCEALGRSLTPRGVAIDTPLGRVEAGLLIAADGLGSPLRKAEGLDGHGYGHGHGHGHGHDNSRGPRRFGARRHYRVHDPSPFVEVHFAERAEAYITPIGLDRVGVALLWEPDLAPAPPSFDAILALFPAVLDRLRGAEPCTSIRGAGPFRRSARRRASDRFVLLGDAAGYIDAITGEGLSLALTSAVALSAVLPSALAAGAPASSFAAYERAASRSFRRYACLTHAVLALTRRPTLRRNIIRILERRPDIFNKVLGLALR